MNISGDLDGYTYYVNKNRKVVAYPASPALRPPTPAQQQQRAKFALAMSAWKQLPEAEKRAYNTACDKLSLCMWGANLYAHLSLRDAGDLHATLQEQSGVSLAVPDSYTDAAVILPGPSAAKIAAWIAAHYPP